MNLHQAATGKKALIFGPENVIFPEKDYLLQVYYLFAQFIEYTEQLESGAVLAFMKSELETNGPEAVFDKAAAAFSIPLKYGGNFDHLHRNAKLPLKLLLYKNVMELMQEAHKQGKLIFLLLPGDPLTALNKIRQIEWNGLEKAVKVYFPEELNLSGEAAGEMLRIEHGLQKEDILHINKII